MPEKICEEVNGGLVSGGELEDRDYDSMFNFSNQGWNLIFCLDVDRDLANLLQSVTNDISHKKHVFGIRLVHL